MSLYHDYLNSKTEVFSKELKFKTAVTEWFDKHNLRLLQPVELSDSITLDLVIISTTKEFVSFIRKSLFQMKNLRNIGNSILKNNNITDEINEDYYVNMKELMDSNLPRPKHKSKYIVNDGEILPIVTITVGLWEW